MDKTNRIKKIFKLIAQFLLGLLMMLLLYFLAAFLLSVISTGVEPSDCSQTEEIYLSSNGIHLDIILENNELLDSLSSQLVGFERANYIAFGWGDRGFYLETPTWNDLKVSTVANALFLESESVMHVTAYSRLYPSFKKVKLCNEQKKKLLRYIIHSFELNDHKVQEIKGAGYSSNDKFYIAKGSYNGTNTCNEWVNRGFKKASIRTAIWSPFDKGIIYQMEKRTEQ